MLGLTPLGIAHTAVSLVALGAAGVALVRDGAIRPQTPLGRVYVATTVVTCVTALGIFQHGGFGKPHGLAILTLLALAFAALVRSRGLFGRHRAAVETVTYSATVLFHLVPAVTETATRLPPGAPLAANADAPGLQFAAAVLLVLFVVLAGWQLRRLRAGAH
ncbi:MAG: hypothetical protein JSR73_04505 [Proteobacteria bacterium]|nr:hypothetical protein [Pseudomonadota bacterium]